MTDSDIAILKDALALIEPFRASGGRSYLAWHPDAKTCIEVTSINDKAPVGFGDEPEPGEVAHLVASRSSYVALYNAELSDFALVTRLA